MKKYVTFVKDAEESRKVQEALFSAGFSWMCGRKSVKHTEYNFLDINFLGSVGCITYTSVFSAVQERIVDDGEIAINAADIIADPFQLDGAKQPEEMIDIDGKAWSKSTIKAALKQYAE
jgi:hypothetical protein